LLVVGLAAFASGAENPTVDVSTPPSLLTTDGSWSATMDVTRQGRPLSVMRPKLTIRNGKEQHSFYARPSGPDGHYRAHVTFPHYGHWSYGVWIGRHYTHGGVVDIRSGAIPGGLAPSGGV
jgi:hypothetical protein